MATMQTYDLKGLKLSFANWISNLSPTDTPFVSMTGKESVDQVKFQWQIDRLSKAAENAVVEGSVAAEATHTATIVKENFTQILRKAVRVTDSAKTTGLYGRSNELSYQMEKAGTEIKRDLEHMFLHNGKGALASKTTVRTTSGFKALVGEGDASGTANAIKLPGMARDPDTGAIVVAESAGADELSREDIFNMTYQLYLSGAKVDTMMIHPKFMYQVSELVQGFETGNSFRMFKNLDDKFNQFVSSLVDPLGQKIKVIPNRFMPEGAVYFFSSKDWTQMVFRSPERTQLSKTGSNEKWMIEMEVGLRHRNPYASGIIYIKPVAAITGAVVNAWTVEANLKEINYAGWAYDIAGYHSATTDAARLTAVKAFFPNAVPGGDEPEVVAAKTTAAPKTRARKASAE